MNNSQFWKNFRMGEELQISGGFIYNGLCCLHGMEHLENEDRVFEVLCHLSVGFERLLKVAVILIEHRDSDDQETLEKTLITHNHLGLLARIKQKHALTLSNPHNEFLQILSGFYKSHRYGRFCVESVAENQPEKQVLSDFIVKHLNLTRSKSSVVADFASEMPRVRKFLGRIAGKISSAIYEIIVSEAGRLNLFTWEIRNGSKAAKIFLSKSYDFFYEEVLWKELLVFFVNAKTSTDHLRFMRQIEPLGFDPGLDVDYLQSFGSEEEKLNVLEELEGLYEEEVNDPANRLEMMQVIGNSCIYFGNGGDEDGEP